MSVGRTMSKSKQSGLLSFLKKSVIAKPISIDLPPADLSSPDPTVLRDPTEEATGFGEAYGFDEADGFEADGFNVAADGDVGETLENVENLCPSSRSSVSSSDESVVVNEIRLLNSKRWKVTKSKDDSHNYLKKWENEKDFKGWLMGVHAKPSKAFCIVCKVEMRAKLYNIKKHRRSDDHKAAIKAIDECQETRPITKFGTTRTVQSTRATKTVEIELAAVVAANTSIRTVDQLTVVLKKWGRDHPILKNIRMRRTKCSRIITNVIAPSLREELVADIGDGFYSVMVDESTSVSTEKMLCTVIKYVSHSLRRVVTTFYRLIHVEACDAKTLSNAILSALREDHLSLDKLIGIGTDGANVMVGAHNSVYSLIKQIQPNICLVRCQCHSLHLSASYACEKLPQRLEFLVEETYSYFAHSSKRQDHFAKVCVTLYSNARKILRRCQTRWLSYYECVDRMYTQWEALILHFEHASSTERSQKAEILLKYFKDLTLKAFLIFVRSELCRFNKINKFLQSDCGTPLELVDQLLDFFESLLIRLVGPSRLKSIPRSQLRTYDFKQHVSSAHSIDFACEDFTIICRKCRQTSNWTFGNAVLNFWWKPHHRYKTGYLKIAISYRCYHFSQLTRH